MTVPHETAVAPRPQRQRVRPFATDGANGRRPLHPPGEGTNVRTTRSSPAWGMASTRALERPRSAGTRRSNTRRVGVVALVWAGSRVRREDHPDSAPTHRRRAAVEPVRTGRERGEAPVRDYRRSRGRVEELPKTCGSGSSVIRRRLPDPVEWRSTITPLWKRAPKATRCGPLTARQRAWAPSKSLNAIASPAADEPEPLVTLVRSRTAAPSRLIAIGRVVASSLRTTGRGHYASPPADRRGAGDTGASQSSYGRRVRAKFIINARGRSADGDRAP